MKLDLWDKIPELKCLPVGNPRGESMQVHSRVAACDVAVCLVYSS